MSKERYNQIIDEVYTNYINKCREEVEMFREQNPFVLVDYQDDTKEIFIKSIKDDNHWFTGEKNFSEKWGLKIEERELSLEERLILNPGTPNENIDYLLDPNNFPHIDSELELKNNLDYKNIPTKLITITYNNETIEVYE